MGEITQIQYAEKLDLQKVTTKTATPVLNKFLLLDEIESLVSQYGTPLYVVDENTLHLKVKELQEAYNYFRGHVKIAYSIKANFNPSILRSFMKDDITFDLTAIGELRFFKNCNGNPENVIYTSVTEEVDEYIEVLEFGIKRIVISSYNGLANLVQAAITTGIKPQTMIRINPEVGVKAEVRASYKNGKFGVPFNSGTIDNAYKLVKYILNNKHLVFEGFHFHLGSQITDFSCYLNALDKLDSFIVKIKKEHPHFHINTLDIGGGTPVFYDDPVPSPTEMTSYYIEKINSLAESHGIFDLIIESGRFLVAESSILVSKIVNTKEFNDHKFVILDSGFHILLDSALLKQEYPQEVIQLPNCVNYKENSTGMSVASTIYKDNNNKLKNIHLAGRLCDTYDVFPISKASNLNNSEIGNYVVFYNVGAYSVVFNMPFHCQTKPPIVMKTENNEFKLIRKGTTYEDLFLEEGGIL